MERIKITLLIGVVILSFISSTACRKARVEEAEPVPEPAKAEISQEELTAAVPELRELHEVVYPLWHNAFPEKDYELIKELLPQAEELTTKLDAADLPGILRDKQQAWDENKAFLKDSLLKLKEASQAGNEQEMLNQTEAFHSGFERLVRTIRPVVSELDDFHKEMYKLYHYHAPQYDIEEIRAVVLAMQEKIVPLKEVTMPARLAERQDDFDRAVEELETAVRELAEVVQKDDKDLVLQVVEKVHTAYQNTEKIFD